MCEGQDHYCSAGGREMIGGIYRAASDLLSWLVNDRPRRSVHWYQAFANVSGTYE